MRQLAERLAVALGHQVPGAQWAGRDVMWDTERLSVTRQKRMGGGECRLRPRPVNTTPRPGDSPICCDPGSETCTSAMVKILYISGRMTGATSGIWVSVTSRVNSAKEATAL